MDVVDFAESKIIVDNCNYMPVKTPKNTQKYNHKKQFTLPKIDYLRPLRNWLNNIKIHEPQLAHLLCSLIPTQCPFQRELKIFGHTILTIPPLCKLNPIYYELMELRFRALSYLAEECGEDVSNYC